jgi:hypothetical protein
LLAGEREAGIAYARVGELLEVLMRTDGVQTEPRVAANPYFSDVQGIDCPMFAGRFERSRALKRSRALS